MNGDKVKIVTDEFGKEYIDLPETYAIVDLGILSGFKFGIGFALGLMLVSFLTFVFFGAIIMTLLSELSRTFL